MRRSSLRWWPPSTRSNFGNIPRAGFTPSGALVQKNVGPLIYEYPSSDCLHPTRTVVIIDILLRTVLQCTLLLQQQLYGSLRPAFLKQTAFVFFCSAEHAELPKSASEYTVQMLQILDFSLMILPR